MKQIIALLTALTLTACAPAPKVQETASRMRIAETSLPAMKLFNTSTPRVGAASNTDIARDFLDLSFQLESGRALPVLTRFEGPISVRVTGQPPASLGPDLAKLITRLRREADIDINLTNAGNANITIQSVTRAQIKRALPGAACFVAPNVDSISDYRRARRGSKTNWTLLQTRTKLAIFLPNDVSPQEVRDCLHEELAQALGPLNDLYRLPNSVFNDDNTHTVLTGFDMLVLRATYSPELASGMTRNQVAQRLPNILAGLHPAGENRGTRRLPATPRKWANAVQTALGAGSNSAQRSNAANATLGIARAEGWSDHRLAFSHQVLGRILMRGDPARAEAHFNQAHQLYGDSADTELHRAVLSAQLGAFALRAGRPAQTLAHIDPYIATAAKAENAALLATLKMLQAEAYAAQGRTTDAGRVRLDSLGWARYGFGEDWAVRAKLRDIASLSPRP